MSLAVERTGLSDTEIRRIIAHKLVVEPLEEEDLAELRRIRRLRSLGVNLAGIEVILHMRRRMIAQRAELARRGTDMPRQERQSATDTWQKYLRWDPD
jgi:hypothetical protein